MRFLLWLVSENGKMDKPRVMLQFWVLLEAIFGLRGYTGYTGYSIQTKSGKT